MVKAPIFKDTVYIYTGDTLTYSVISQDGDTIFNGRAYAAPNEDTIKININRICENYLDNYDIEPILTGSSSQVVAYNAYKEFTLKDDSGNTLETYEFLYDYDYEVDFDTTGFVLSDPITDGSDGRSYNLYTVFDGSEVVNSTSSPAYTRLVCGAEYALYYLNSHGGWDCLVIEGSAERTDKVDRHSYNKVYNNQTIEYEKNSYISEITTNWKLNTGLLDNIQAYKLCWNLLPSNRVYLHDLYNDIIVPVIITNTSNIYHTYENNNKQPIQYEIDITESQTKLRR